MGWFSKRIMGGDEAMDYLSVIVEACGLSSEEHLDKKSLEESQLKIYEVFKEMDASIIAFQALAYKMVELGCKFEQKIFDMCKKCLEEDEWAKADVERRFHVSYLLKTLTEYDTTPTSPESDVKEYEHKGSDFDVIIPIVKSLLNPKFATDVTQGLKGYGYCLVVNVNDLDHHAFVDWYKSDECPKEIFGLTMIYA